MWNMSFTPPVVIEAGVLTRVPDALRRTRHTEWAASFRHGQIVDCFLEGPSFDREGNLYLVNIPHGGIFKVTPALEWSLAAEYDGWPNGLAIHSDGSVWIADHRRGILKLNPESHEVETILGHRNCEGFKGVNDLTFDLAGRLYFTDQGQTGLTDPTGRVYRLDTDGRLDVLLANGPSPNGIALSPDGSLLYVAVTRASQVWRAPIMPDGSITKVQAFRTFFGASGPDGLAATGDGGIVAAHPSLGHAFVMNAAGEVTHVVRSPVGHNVTNIAFRPGTSELVMTESSSGTVLQATLPVRGAALFSHA